MPRRLMPRRLVPSWARLRAGLAAAPLLLPIAAAPQRPADRPSYGPPPPPTPYDLCDAAVVAARTKIVPEMLLPAIARVESGRLDPVTGRVRPWPWTINVDGTGSFFDSKQDAIAAVQALQAKGKTSIDVGCMQVNLFFHPDAFPTLDDAFDPAANAAYAVRFLTGLFGQTRDWSLAAAYYHSQTQEFGEDYQRRVFGRVVTPMGPPPAPKQPPTPFAAFAAPAAVYGAFPPAAQQFGAFAPAPDTPPGLHPVLPTGLHPATPAPAKRR